MADKVIVLSKSAQDYFKSTYNRETIYIPNGINPKRLRPDVEIRQRWGLKTGSYILYLGRLVPEKRPELLIEAFKGLATSKRLVIAGKGSDTPEYERELRELANDDPRIMFAGFVTGETLAELYSNAFCYVLPSDVEGMPMSLLEAMAYGCACITSDIPECADVLAGTGMTFQRGDASALRESLEGLLSDSSRASVLGASARNRVLINYGWDAVVCRILETYEEAGK